MQKRLLRFITTAAVMAAIVALPLAAQNDYRKAAQPITGKDGAYSYVTYPGDPLGARYYTLGNGLTVILSVNTSTPRIQTLIAVKAGSKNDPATNTGLAHYLEHMLFKGTDKYGSANWEKERKEIAVIEGLYDRYNKTTDPSERARIYRSIDSVSGIAATYAIANEYDKMVGMIGASGTNAFTSTEQTVYMNDIPSNQIDRWLTIEGERFRNPVFRLFHTELEAVYEEKNISLDNDGNQAYEALMADVFRIHPYGTQTTIGTVEHLKNPSLIEIRKYYDTYYVPNNMAVIMAGDLDPAKTVAAIDKAFGQMKSKPVPEFVYRPEVARSAPRMIDVTGPEAENLLMAWRFPGAGTREALLLEMADLLLAYKGAGLIDINLNQAQRVQSAGCSPDISKDYSVHLFFGTPKEGQSLEEVRDLILEQIAILKKGEFTAETMQAVIRNLKVDQMNEFEENSGRAFNLLGTFVTGVDPMSTANHFRMMEMITKDELVSFVNKYYDDDYTVVFKRMGEIEAVAKVEKPTITPVAVNRADVSPFVQAIATSDFPPITPVYIDYKKDILRSTLPSGIELMMVPNSENDLFRLYYVFDMGSDNDKTLPFAMDYLNYLGAGDMTSEDISRKFFALGVTWGVNVGRDRTTLSLSGPNESFEPALALFEKLLATAKPNEEALEGIKAMTLKGREDAKTDNSTVLRQGMIPYAIYGEDNPTTWRLSNDDLGELESDDLIDRIQSITGYKHRVLYYGPRSATELGTVLTQYHKTPKTLADYPERHVFARNESDRNVVYFVDFDMVQAEVLWVNKVGAYDPALQPTVSMFNEYFGGGMSSIVFQDIRESKALAYSTFSTFQTPSRPEDPYYILSYVGTQSDKLADAITAMNALHTELPQSDQSYMAAREALRNKLETERVTRADILFNALDAEKFNRTEDSRKALYESIDRFSFDQLSAFHAARYPNAKYALLVIGSKETIDKELLKKYGEVVELSVEDVMGE